MPGFALLWYMESNVTLEEQAAPYGTPVPAEVLRMAQEAVKEFHECFWWWDEKAEISTPDDVRQVVENLRLSGGHRAWHRAQLIHKLCL